MAKQTAVSKEAKEFITEQIKECGLVTVEELKAYPKPYITPDIAAKVTGQKPHEIRLQARQRPELLGYPVCVTGTRTRIPKWSFIKFWFGEDKR